MGAMIRSNLLTSSAKSVAQGSKLQNAAWSKQAAAPRSAVHNAGEDATTLPYSVDPPMSERGTSWVMDIANLLAVPSSMESQSRKSFGRSLRPFYITKEELRATS